MMLSRVLRARIGSQDVQNPKKQYAMTQAFVLHLPSRFISVQAILID